MFPQPQVDSYGVEQDEGAARAAAERGGPSAERPWLTAWADGENERERP
jgi:hypothetical protein